MGHDRQGRGPGHSTLREDRIEGPQGTDVPGKHTLAEALPGSSIDTLIAQARARGGAALEGELRAALEAALGTSLGDVTLHTSADAADAARAAGADAFAHGTDVFFAAGQHDPSSPEGRALIAHEVAHTVQQRGATSTERSISAPGDRHEVEAERFASSFVAGEPVAPVQTGSISRGAISRQAAGTRPPVTASPQERPDAFTIQPAQSVAVLGTTPMYMVPGARSTPGGRYLCTWRVEPDPAANAPRQRLQLTPTWMTPMTSAPVRWIAEGRHTLHCDLRWERDQNAPAGRLVTPPPPARHLELAVHVRAIENISRERFDDVARPDAYFQARLTDLVPEAHAARGGAGVDDPQAARARRDRVRVQEENSDKIESGRQVICRAQLTIRANAQTVPLAIAIGPARTERGKLILIDFTPNQRRMDYGTASSTAEAIDNFKHRNSYPAGLVEIDVPANESGVAPHHATFETSGESSLGQWSSGFGAAGMAGMVAGGLALLASAPVSVPLLLISGALAGVGSAISLAERLHDAQPSATGIAIDALGVVASVLGLGGLAAARGGLTTVTYNGRVMSVVDMTGRLALAADGAALVLVSKDALDEIRGVWADASKSESERMQAIAGIVARVTAQGGMLVATGRQTLRERGPAAPRDEPAPREPSRDAPAPREPSRDAPAVRDPDAGAVPASVVRAAQSPQEVLRAMQDDKARVLAGRTSSRDDGSWRELVDGETNFVRVIGRGELESLIGRGQVTSRRVDTLMRDPVGANRELMERLARRDPQGRLIIPDELPVTSGGRQDPVLPISAFAPAETGYTQALGAERGQGFLVKFRPTVRRVASQNQDLRETEYFIPLWYRLDEVEWIADVRNNRWLWGGPGRTGTPEEAAALRRELGLDANPLAAPPRGPVPIPPEVRREEELRSLVRRTLDRARGDRELREELNQLHARVHNHVDNTRAMRQRGTVDEELAAQELAALERELATLLDRLAARVGPRAR